MTAPELALVTPRTSASIVGRLVWLAPVVLWLGLATTIDPYSSGASAVLPALPPAPTTPTPAQSFTYAVLPQDAAMQIVAQHTAAIFTSCSVRGAHAQVRVTFGPGGMAASSLLVPRHDDSCVARALPSVGLPTSASTVSYDLDLRQTPPERPSSARRHREPEPATAARAAAASALAEAAPAPRGPAARAPTEPAAPIARPPTPAGQPRRARRPERIW